MHLCDAALASTPIRTPMTRQHTEQTTPTITLVTIELVEARDSVTASVVVTAGEVLNRLNYNSPTYLWSTIHGIWSDSIGSSTILNSHHAGIVTSRYGPKCDNSVRIAGLLWGGDNPISLNNGGSDGESLHIGTVNLFINIHQYNDTL